MVTKGPLKLEVDTGQYENSVRARAYFGTCAGTVACDFADFKRIRGVHCYRSKKKRARWHTYTTPKRFKSPSWPALSRSSARVYPRIQRPVLLFREQSRIWSAAIRGQSLQAWFHRLHFGSVATGPFCWTERFCCFVLSAFWTVCCQGSSLLASGSFIQPLLLYAKRVQHFSNPPAVVSDLPRAIRPRRQKLFPEENLTVR